MEGLVGATIGKMVLGMRVTKVDGSPCDLQAALIRNILRIVDALPFYLIGAILVWTSSRRQRLGDRVANTVVVSKADWSAVAGTGAGPRVAIAVSSRRQRS